MKADTYHLNCDTVVEIDDFLRDKIAASQRGIRTAASLADTIHIRQIRAIANFIDAHVSRIISEDDVKVLERCMAIAEVTLNLVYDIEHLGGVKREARERVAALLAEHKIEVC